MALAKELKSLSLRSYERNDAILIQMISRVCFVQSIVNRRVNFSLSIPAILLTAHVTPISITCGASILGEANETYQPLVFSRR